MGNERPSYHGGTTLLTEPLYNSSEMGKTPVTSDRHPLQAIQAAKERTAGIIEKGKDAAVVALEKTRQQIEGVIEKGVEKFKGKEDHKQRITDWSEHKPSWQRRRGEDELPRVEKDDIEVEVKETTDFPETLDDAIHVSIEANKGGERAAIGPQAARNSEDSKGVPYGGPPVPPAKIRSKL